MSRTHLYLPIVTAAALLCLSSGAAAQFLPPSIPTGSGGILPRAQQMKSDARGAKDASQSRSNASQPAPTTRSSQGATGSGKETPASSIHRAASTGDTGQIRAELATNPQQIKRKDAEGFTPLHLAAHGGHLEALRLLLESNPEVDAQGSRGETALYLAAAEGDEAIVMALLAAGADPNLATVELKTALHRAAQEGHLAAVKALLKGGADASLKDKQGRTALDLAERYRVGDDANQVISELIKARK